MRRKPIGERRFRVGQRVEAVWAGAWHPAEITGIHSDGTYEVYWTKEEKRSFGYTSEQVRPPPVAKVRFKTTSGHQDINVEYEIVKELNAFGASCIGYMARDSFRGDKVFLKLARNMNSLRAKFPNCGNGYYKGRLSRIQRDFQVEVKVLNCCKHENIIKLIAAPDGGYADYTDENGLTKRVMIFALELADMDLFSLVEQSGISPAGYHRIPEADAKIYIRQILDALDALHKAGYAHCDIKLQNIFVMSGPPVAMKLGDFGGALLLNTQTTSQRGTKGFKAPENVGVRVYHYTKASDIFALGVTIFCMVHGCKPFDGAKSSNKHFQRLENEDYKGFWQLAKDSGKGVVSGDMQNLIQNMICADPHDRASIDTLKDLLYAPETIRSCVTRMEKRLSAERPELNHDRVQQIASDACEGRGLWEIVDILEDSDCAVKILEKAMGQQLFPDTNDDMSVASPVTEGDWEMPSGYHAPREGDRAHFLSQIKKLRIKIDRNSGVDTTPSGYYGPKILPCEQVMGKTDAGTGTDVAEFRKLEDRQNAVLEDLEAIQQRIAKLKNYIL